MISFGSLRISAAFVGLFTLAFSSAQSASETSDTRWWPEQRTPKSLAVMESGVFGKLAKVHGGDRAAALDSYQMLAMSLSGLAAQAVNEKGFDELLWISPRGNASYAEWLKRLVARTGVSKRPCTDLWGLVREYAGKGVVKGYILYKREPVSRDDRKGTPGDESCNAATVMAGLLGGVLVEEDLRAEAEKIGLTMLLDARPLTEEAIFAKEKDRLSRKYLLVQSPDLPDGRDLAIAHRMMVCFGREKPITDVYEWLEPIGTVFGWNAEPEDQSVKQASRAGHLFIPCDWATNLPALSCGAAPSLRGISPRKFQAPASVALSPKQSAMGLLMSDGDNVQWALTTLAHNPKYWANPQRNTFPLAWGLPLGDLLQIAPDAYDYFAETQGANTSIFLHLGYYYPDDFGELRGDAKRAELLQSMARRMQLTFAATGVSLFTFLAHNPEGEKTRQACEIFAAGAPALNAIFAVAYDPYEKGEGKTLWFSRTGGRDVPLVTASYALWNITAADRRPRAGGPSALAEKINARAASASSPFSEWTILHAWSEYPSEENGLPKGMEPTARFASLLQGSVTVVPVEQIVDRLRAARENTDKSRQP